MVSINSLVKEVESLGVNIRAEIVEDSLRVSGNTYPVRGELKLLGFQWDPKQREWYYHAKEVNLDKYEFESFRD